MVASRNPTALRTSGTVRQGMREAENQNLALYYRVFEEAPDASFIVDSSGRIAKASVRMESLFGYTRDEVEGHQIEMLIPARYTAQHIEHRRNFVALPKPRHMGSACPELFARRNDGSEFAVDVMIAPLQVGTEVFTLCAVRDISAQKAIESKLRHHTAELENQHQQLKALARHDPLTGLLNRRAFQEHADQLLSNAARRKASTSLLMIDLDSFKRVNDQFGHIEGDRVLTTVAAVLQSTCRQNDLPARYGGEEFVVLLPDTDEFGSLVVAENFRAAVQAMTGLKVPITASIGIATYVPKRTERASLVLLLDLIKHADGALYAAKRAGRNRVRHGNALSEASKSDDCPALQKS